MVTQFQDIDQMDFDELEYIENKLDNPEPKKSENKANGSDEKGGYEDKERRRSSRHRRDELDGSSKRSSSRKESNGHEKDRKSRNGASSRDRERSTREHRIRDKERSRDRDGDRNRERDSDKKRDRNKERRGDREYERERNRDKEREHSKRSRNHVERHEDEQGREKSSNLESTREKSSNLESTKEKSSNLESREKDVEEVQKERGFRGQDNDNRKYKEKEEGVETKADPERDQRTVFAYQVSLKADERDLYDFFSSVGKVRDVQLIMDRNTRRSKGVGYIEFYDSMSVPMAIALSGQLLLDHPVMVKPSEAERNIVGHSIMVSAVTDKAGMQDAGANMADFDDDDEDTRLSLNANSRTLVQKLDRTSITFPVLPGLTDADLSMPPLTGPSIDSVDVPSECLLLKNMFDPNAETEPDFDLDIKEDCESECSQYGSLKHIYVEKNSDGFVYLRFEHTKSAVEAQLALHGRWFAGKMITATFMLHQEYEAKFPECG